MYFSIRSSFCFPYFVAAGETAVLACGEATGLTLGDAVTFGEDIAGVSETTGTLGLTVGVATFDLQPESIASSIKASVI